MGSHKVNDLESRSAAPDDVSLNDSEIERLGRQRPDAFSSTFKEILFGSSLLMSMLMAVGLVYPGASPLF